MALKRTVRRPMSDINVVPYIDVMLVLLVIFMITAPLLSEGVNVNLPQAAAKQLPAQERGPLIISVDAMGHYYLNTNSHPNIPVDAATLINQVSAELKVSEQQGQQRQVFVKGDQHVDYGKVVQAMVLLQQAGAPSIGLMTQSPPSLH